MCFDTAFWRLTAPDYDSNYRHTFINGSLKHAFGLPGVECESCGATWGGSRILAMPCPDEMRQRKELNDRWPISGEAHRRLRAEVATAIRKNGHVVEELRPGDSFQPGFLEVPSKPQADFLWASLGSVVVSERIRELLEEAGCRGVQLKPVIDERLKTSHPAKEGVWQVGSPDLEFGEVLRGESAHDGGYSGDLNFTPEGMAESSHRPGIEHRPGDGRKVHPGIGLRSKTSHSAHRLDDDGRAGDP